MIIRWLGAWIEIPRWVYWGSFFILLALAVASYIGRDAGHFVEWCDDRGGYYGKDKNGIHTCYELTNRL